LPDEQRTEVALAWLAAARRYVAKVTPLGDPGAVAKELEPSDGFLERAIAEVEANEARAKSRDSGTG
jgi:hypothetical protein